MGCCSTKPRQNQIKNHPKNGRSRSKEPRPPYQKRDTSRGQSKVTFGDNPQVVDISDTERRRSKKYSLKNRKRNKTFTLPDPNQTHPSILTKSNVSTAATQTQTQVPEAVETENTAHTALEHSVTPLTSVDPSIPPPSSAPVQTGKVEPEVRNKVSLSRSTQNIETPAPNTAQKSQIAYANPNQPPNVQYSARQVGVPYNARGQYMGSQMRYVPQRQVVVASQPPIIMSPYPYFYDQCYFDPFYSGFYGGYGYDDGFWW